MKIAKTRGVTISAWGERQSPFPATLPPAWRVLPHERSSFLSRKITLSSIVIPIATSPSRAYAHSYEHFARIHRRPRRPGDDHHLPDCSPPFRREKAARTRPWCGQEHG